MKYGFLSDVRGDLEGLERALESLRCAFPTSIVKPTHAEPLTTFPKG